MCYTVSLVTFDLFELETFNFLLCKTYIELELCLKIIFNCLSLHWHFLCWKTAQNIFNSAVSIDTMEFYVYQISPWNKTICEYPHETKPYANIPMKQNHMQISPCKNTSAYKKIRHGCVGIKQKTMVKNLVTLFL